MYFRKEKMIYTNLSKCHVRDNFIDGEVWILEKNFNELNQILADLNKDESRVPVSFTELPPNKAERPTYTHTNDFIWPFQEIVDTYGIPKYKEINPTYFNIVTFPFLFGVMFGDIGHGLIVLIFALYLCYKSDDIKRDVKSPLRMLAKGRYLFLLMGIFAFYAGWMYNDFLSLSLPVFGTCYENNDKIHQAIKKEDCTYPFGLDPKWRSATNELSFVNSLKMKMSVIFGVLQMLFGLILRGLNDVYFGNYSGLFLETIPQTIFLSILFGYMDVMIYIKWAHDWSDNTAKAPSLISQMMGIFLNGGSVDGKPTWGGKSEDGEGYVQEKFQVIILIISLLLIPLMLIPKPIITYYSQKKKKENPNFNRLQEDNRLVSRLIDKLINKFTNSPYLIL